MVLWSSPAAADGHHHHQVTTVFVVGRVVFLRESDVGMKNQRQGEMVTRTQVWLFSSPAFASSILQVWGAVTVDRCCVGTPIIIDVHTEHPPLTDQGPLPYPAALPYRLLALNPGGMCSASSL